MGDSFHSSFRWLSCRSSPVICGNVAMTAAEWGGATVLVCALMGQKEFRVFKWSESSCLPFLDVQCSVVASPKWMKYIGTAAGEPGAFHYEVFLFSISMCERGKFRRRFVSLTFSPFCICNRRNRCLVFQRLLCLIPVCYWIISERDGNKINGLTGNCGTFCKIKMMLFYRFCNIL